MAAIRRAFWFFAVALFSLLLRFIRENVLRIGQDDEESINLPTETDGFPSEACVEEEEEDGKFRFQFKFSFQNPESVITYGEKTEQEKEEGRFPIGSRDWESVGALNVDSYRFLPERGIRGFLHEPEIMTLPVMESFAGGGDYDSERIDRELRERFSRVKAVVEEEGVKLAVLERSMSFSSCEWEETSNGNLEIEDVDDPPPIGNSVLDGHTSSMCLKCERDLGGIGFLDSPSTTDGYSVKDLFLGYSSDDVWSEREFDDDTCRENHPEDSSSSSLAVCFDSGHALEEDGVMDQGSTSEEVVGQFPEEFMKELGGLEEGNSPDLSEGLIDSGSADSSASMAHDQNLGGSDRPYCLESDSDVENPEGDGCLMSDYSGELDPSLHESLREFEEEKLREMENIMNDMSLAYEGYQGDLKALNLKRLDDSDEEAEDEFQLMSRDLDTKYDVKQEIPSTLDLDFEDSDEDDELESLWEHHDLVEQLKLEIKRAKETKLPTIMEESEIKVEDLKTCKIEAKFLQESPMDELHKFYKSYRERMRKFDILNFQKMYAIEFLQLKDPLRSIGVGKLTFTSLFAENLWPCRRRKSKNDPTEKFVRELQGDLETVYVGQVCLSWEFLWWQYEKFQKFPKSDARGLPQYNQVAGEFQKFQVMLQRFLEDEPFQGARVPHYVKTRSLLRTLLQVPFIKEDSKKERMEDEKRGSKVVTSESLIYTMEKCIRILWNFIKADKDETPSIIKGLAGNRSELLDPTDHDLKAQIQAILHKKEKKLNDVLRVGNCLVKKFKKPQEQRLSKDLFCSQVDIKLVSRVLEMSRITTEQLVWCHAKLEKITFSERRLCREPSFLLFPC